MSQMLLEAHEAPGVVARQLVSNLPLLERLAERFQQHPPRFITMSARGSSNNAAVYAKYLIETRLGLPVVSSAPSIGTLYRARIDLRETIMLCVSQSGASFDLVENARWAKGRGAWVISLLNNPNSPLGDVSDSVVPLHAGEETSVAATKSFIASLSAMLQLVACVEKGRELPELLDRLPDQLALAIALDWSRATEPLCTGPDLFVVGRGLGLCVAREAALKFKETCDLHAEAFSGAEVLHGPSALVRNGLPVLLFGQADGTRPSSAALARRLRVQGAVVFAAGLSDAEAPPTSGAFGLPTIPGIHAAVAPLTQSQTLYGLLDLVARHRGVDPDQPAHLTKVTRTQ